MSQVLYRKYRPRSFEEITGQEHVVITLQNAIKNGELSHAYLFTGPRGTGKTTVARILAKTINCTDSLAEKACLKCSTCEAVEKGNYIDLIEIDAASNRGIDDVRELKDSVHTSPNVGQYKIYLVDEAHMLTTPAANALLKVLEEPPAHSIFILATTEPHKLLPTIISRTQRFDFRFLNIDEIVTRLRDLIKREGKKIDDAVLRLVVTASGGSMRDAESILGKILSLASPTAEQVRGLLGITDVRHITKLIDCIADSKKEEAINFVNNLEQKGLDLEQFLTSMLNYMRKLLYLKLSPSSEKLLAGQLSEEEIGVAKAQAGKLTEQQIYSIIKEFMEALGNTKYSPVPSLPLELAVINLTEGPQLRG